MPAPRSLETFARENERARAARLRADAKRPPVERLRLRTPRTTSGWRLFWSPSTPHAALAADAAEIQWRGGRLRICSLEHLRLMKRTAGWPQDLQDLRDLDVAHAGAAGGP